MFTNLCIVCSHTRPACFKVSTGDVEDAPALDPLAKFEVYERDGVVYIKGEEQTIKSSRRNLKIKCSAKGNEKVVIIGRYAYHARHDNEDGPD